MRRTMNCLGLAVSHLCTSCGRNRSVPAAVLLLLLLGVCSAQGPILATFGECELSGLWRARLLCTSPSTSQSFTKQINSPPVPEPDPGAGNSGQLGNGAYAGLSVPTAVSATAGVSVGWAAVAGGYYHTCAIAAGTSALYCWGVCEHSRWRGATSSPPPAILPPAQLLGSDCGHRQWSVCVCANQVQCLRQ